MAQERRERIVTNFTFRIWHAVKQQKSQKYQEALVAAMSDTMAVEAGKRAYLGMNSAEIDTEIEKNVQLSLAIHLDVFKKSSYQEVRQLGIRFDDLSGIYAHAVWMNREFNTNFAMPSKVSFASGSIELMPGKLFLSIFLISG